MEEHLAMLDEAWEAINFVTEEHGDVMLLNITEDDFEVLEAERLISVILPENAPSIRVAEKLGEHFDRRMQLQGHDVHVYAVEREAWRDGQREAR